MLVTANQLNACVSDLCMLVVGGRVTFVLDHHARATGTTYIHNVGVGILDSHVEKVQGFPKLSINAIFLVRLIIWSHRNFVHPKREKTKSHPNHDDQDSNACTIASFSLLCRMQRLQ